MVGIIIGGVVVVGVGAFWAGVYNKLIKKRNFIEESWGQIDVQLKRQFELIPNLVETVKGYATHEAQTLEKVIAARSSLVNGGEASRDELVQNGDALGNSLKSIFALSESYPELKANENFGALQEELTNTSNKIAYARQLYNSCVVEYNNTREVFPNNIIAGIHNFNKTNVLEAAPEEKAIVKVSF